jgi:hypothetical protein
MALLTTRMQAGVHRGGLHQDGRLRQILHRAGREHGNEDLAPSIVSRLDSIRWTVWRMVKRNTLDILRERGLENVTGLQDVRFDEFQGIVRGRIHPLQRRRMGDWVHPVERELEPRTSPSMKLSLGSGKRARISACFSSSQDNTIRLETSSLGSHALRSAWSIGNPFPIRTLGSRLVIPFVGEAVAA